MAIPTFQMVLLPLLKLMGDAKARRHSDVFEALAKTFQLTPEELKELLPSGAHPKFENRVRWAKWRLTRAGLLENVDYGVFKISDTGRALLEQNPTHLTTSDLEVLGGGGPSGGGVGAEPDQTPEEILATTYRGLTDELAVELLTRVKAASPVFFERLVIELLVRMGYGGSRRDAAQAVGKSGDEGVDGVINEDALGLDVVLVQAKRWQDTVGRPVVQGFAGSLEGRRARKGIFITTSSFSKDARDYVGQIEKRIVLIDGTRLAELMIEHGVGVSNVETYVVKRLDEDFFAGEAPTVAPMEL